MNRRAFESQGNEVQEERILERPVTNASTVAAEILPTLLSDSCRGRPLNGSSGGRPEDLWKSRGGVLKVGRLVVGKRILERRLTNAAAVAAGILPTPNFPTLLSGPRRGVPLDGSSRGVLEGPGRL